MRQIQTRRQRLWRNWNMKFSSSTPLQYTIFTTNSTDYEIIYCVFRSIVTVPTWINGLNLFGNDIWSFISCNTAFWIILSTIIHGYQFKKIMCLPEKPSKYEKIVVVLSDAVRPVYYLLLYWKKLRWIMDIYLLIRQ